MVGKFQLAEIRNGISAGGRAFDPIRHQDTVAWREKVVARNYDCAEPICRSASSSLHHQRWRLRLSLGEWSRLQYLTLRNDLAEICSDHELDRGANIGFRTTIANGICRATLHGRGSDQRYCIRVRSRTGAR